MPLLSGTRSEAHRIHQITHHSSVAAIMTRDSVLPKIDQYGELHILCNRLDRVNQLYRRLQGHSTGSTRWKRWVCFKIHRRSPPPTLDYSTYLGGNGNDECRGIAVANISGSEYAYVTGVTYSRISRLSPRCKIWIHQVMESPSLVMRSSRNSNRMASSELVTLYRWYE